MAHFDKYVTSWQKPYEEPNSIGYLSLPILHFLVGRTWDQLALNFVHSVNPKCIRVVVAEETTDAVCGRVTVRLDKDWKITSIDQECEVGLEGGYDHGQHLWTEFERTAWAQ